MGVEEIVFVATLDHRTSEVCQHADGKRIKLADAVAGENIPPLHPNCRSTIRAYIGDDFEPTERWDNEAQDVIAQTSYKEWAKAYDYGASFLNWRGAGDGTAKRPSYYPFNSPLESFAADMVGEEIDYLAVADLQKPLTGRQIIARLCGHDETGGSCQSLALAYAANKAGLDVLDFRGGRSAEYFADLRTLIQIIDVVGCKYELLTDRDAYKVAHALLAKMESRKKYILAVGEHTAIVQRGKNGQMQYLELQDRKRSNNRFMDFDSTTLKERFACAHSHRSGEYHFTQRGVLVDIDGFKGSKEFRRIMGYINTNKDEQQKVQDGRGK